jgi:hypothetical protein
MYYSLAGTSLPLEVYMALEGLQSRPTWVSFKLEGVMTLSNCKFKLEVG